MLLAGGKGTRLGALTKNVAKPAVHFGGKYRMIDFTLSNCINSGIRSLGVMTQYAPLELNKHIGNGKAWYLNRQTDGLAILSPYIARDGGDWYSGTADAIYQNIHFIDQHHPKYVLVISADHIYHMDYGKMLDYHKASQADATISVIPVPWTEAPRFGILNTTEDMRIYEFDEKPEQPRSNLASMGIYIFTWEKLKTYLLADALSEESSHDFGHDIIPTMVDDDLRLFAYQFNGYWKDVGTIRSYWEANMDLLDENINMSLIDRSWRVYTNESNTPPEYIGRDAEVKNSLINAGCWIRGKVEHSILFERVIVSPNSTIIDSIIHPDVKIGENVILDRVIVMEKMEIPSGTIIQIDPDAEPIVIDQKTLLKFTMLNMTI
jgi:glucose-1-phosphate adenylyltransferase